MEEKTNGLFSDILRHLIEHIIAVELIFHKRILLGIRLKPCTLTQLIHVINMIHPLPVNHLEKDHALNLPDCFRLREFRLLALVQLHCLFF